MLDTNAAIAILNRSPEIAARIMFAGKLHVPVVVLGELEYGARRSVRRVGNLDAVDLLLSETSLVVPDRTTAAHYGDVHTGLRRKGRPIPQNDMWIAALALQHGLPLLTRDAHFNQLEGLTLITW